MTKEELKSYVDKGLSASKDALDKAGKAVSKFGDESILKIEIQQLKSQIKKETSALGEYVLNAFETESKESVAASEEKVIEILNKIKGARKEIEEREEKLKS